MIQPDRMERTLREWLSAPAPMLPDEAVERALEQLPGVRRRGQWRRTWRGATGRNEAGATRLAGRAVLAGGLTAIVLGAMALVGPSALVGGRALPDGIPDLAAMRTEPVPGVPEVVRVIDDGAGHALGERPQLLTGDPLALAVAPDGAVWVSPGLTPFSLGVADSIGGWARADGIERAVTADGAEWVAAGDQGLRTARHGGDARTIPVRGDPGAAWSVATAPDGSVWAGFERAVVRVEPKGTVTTFRFYDDTLPRPHPMDERITGLEISGDGTVWAGTAGQGGPVHGFRNDGIAAGGLLRWDGTGWDVVDVSPLMTPGDTLYGIVPFAAGGDRLWVWLSEESWFSGPAGGPGFPLATVDAAGRLARVPAQLTPDLSWGLPYGSTPVIEAGPDGRLWYPRVRGGLASFDGLTEVGYLAPDHGPGYTCGQDRDCTDAGRPADLVVTPDGTVWFSGGGDPFSARGLYALHP